MTIADALAAGLEDLAAANFDEVEHLGDLFPFAPNWRGLQALERCGDFVGVGAFCKGDLVGYAGYTLMVPDHHAGDLWAFNRVIYMAPEHRGWGSLDLLETGEALMRERGARVVLQAVKEPHSTDGERSAKLRRELLLRKGYRPYESLLAKVL